MKLNKKRIWFPAKKYGWGWGLPNVWQGWLVILVYILLVLTACIYLLNSAYFGLWILAISVLTLTLIIICFFKGEKPRWRWGTD
jgi:hypothetical protein